MSKKQIAALFVCSLVILTIGNGLIPLLPVYAAHLGADAAVAGYYLAVSYAALAIGAMAAGWLSNKLQRRKLILILTGLISVPITWMIGQAGNIFALVVLTASLWFCGGLMLALVNILAGMSAGQNERGKVFGILSLTTGLGVLLGGISTGYLVDRWGYSVMFAIAAVFMAVLPLAGTFLNEPQISPPQSIEKQTGRQHGLGTGFNLLFTANLVASIAGFIIVFGRSLMMNNMGFTATAIASTGIIGGVIGMPLSLLAGWLSDRTGRKNYLYLGYIAGLCSLLLLAISTSLWHFWLAIGMQTVSMAITVPIGNALVTDLVPKEAVASALSRYGATSWFGGVLGFAGAGIAFSNLGTLPTLGIGALLAALSIALLIPIRTAQKHTNNPA